MKPFSALVLSFFLSLSAYCQTNSETPAETDEAPAAAVARKQPFDLGVTKVEYYPQNGKHYIRVWYKNFGTAPVMNFQLQYTINGGPAKTVTIPGSIAPGATMQDPKIPFGSVGFVQADGIRTGGKLNTFRVCTVIPSGPGQPVDTNAGNNCKTRTVTIF